MKKDTQNNSESKVLTAATATLISAVLFGVFTLLTAFVTFWFNNQITPRYQAHNEEVIAFNKARRSSYKNFVESLRKMRFGYRPFIEACLTDSILTDEQLKNYEARNKEYLRNVMQSVDSFSFYFGKPIREIASYELNWYDIHTSKCPDKNVIERLRNKEHALVRIMLKKMYDPREDFDQYDSKFYRFYQ